MSSSICSSFNLLPTSHRIFLASWMHIFSGNPSLVVLSVRGTPSKDPFVSGCKDYTDYCYSFNLILVCNLTYFFCHLYLLNQISASGKAPSNLLQLFRSIDFDSAVILIFFSVLNCLLISPSIKSKSLSIGYSHLMVFNFSIYSLGTTSPTLKGQTQHLE